ncbi:MAG: adenylate cyclase, partial [Prevotella sp.]|nr:adenylate cyclase [Prevotella sp.]
MKNCCKLLLFCALIGSLFVACEDNYSYNDEEPPKTMLGESIYDWLKNDGHFTYYLRIVESVQDAGTNYTEVLKTTGTKTVFVADDEAFEAFFADNPYGIRSFEDFTTAQKRAIFFSCMLNDAYLIEMMSSTPGSSGAKPNQGQALRRTTAWTILDSIPFETPDRLPETSYWDSFRENGMYLMKDNSQWMMVHFLEPNMRVQGITAEDFRYLTKTKENPAGQEWDRTAAYIFNTKVIRKDITCKNGYINILEKLLLPADNIAEYIRNNNDVKLFSRLLDRYCAPFYDASSTSAYRELHPDFSERIYAKRFFTEDFNYLPDANGVTSDKKALGTLKFDIGKNAYSPDGSQGDMGAIFVPTDAAMNKYFNEGSGLLLKERYGVLDSVPDDVISLLLNNHIQKSFIQSMPDRFER